MMEITGYYPGVIGRITELHATYYHDNWNLDMTFETQVGRELSEFIDHFHPERDGLWIAKIAGAFAGSVAIGGAETEGVARLRWFIVAPGLQGRGIGGELLRTAISSSRKRKYEKIYLWTFKGLDRARSLYESEGFILLKEKNVHQWGIDLTEQMFTLRLGE
ncbi:MAG: GNAT family N-acetyltransferase [Deltaproteobacteria bacterium]|nr:GNAT family N-acetyltransferase [Deltaproteobacteria bacterium]MBN2845079.1 GNAT family N-acetyltransferase [Deltaproteobacteria bacterium]